MAGTGMDMSIVDDAGPAKNSAAVVPTSTGSSASMGSMDMSKNNNMDMSKSNAAAKTKRRRRDDGYAAKSSVDFVRVYADVCDVGDDDGSDDVTVRRADDSALCGDESQTRDSFFPVRTDKPLCDGLPAGVGCFLPTRYIGPRAIAFGGPAFANDGNHQYDTGGDSAAGCRPLSVDSIQIYLSPPLPFAPFLPAQSLAARLVGRGADGSRTWRLLPGMLLGFNGAALCRRHYEPALDCNFGGAGVGREDCSGGPLPKPDCRRRLHCLGHLAGGKRHRLKPARRRVP